MHPLADRPLQTGARPSGLHTIALRIERRGRYLIDPPVVAVSDPFGLLCRRVVSGDPIPVLALPRIEPVVVGAGAGSGADRLLGSVSQGSDGGGLDPRGVEFEVEGIRPFQDGTPASRIHWPTVARSGELVERRLVSGASSPPLVVLDAFEPASGESLDRAVRAAASICAHLAADGGCSLLLPQHRHSLRIAPGGRGWRRAHAMLALAESSNQPPPATDLRAAESVFLVSASASPGTSRPPRSGPGLPGQRGAGRRPADPLHRRRMPRAGSGACRGCRRGGVNRERSRHRPGTAGSLRRAFALRGSRLVRAARRPPASPAACRHCTARRRRDRPRRARRPRTAPPLALAGVSGGGGPRAGLGGGDPRRSRAAPAAERMG